MSDAEKRDATMSARRLDKTAYAIRLVEEFVRLRAENITLKAAVERVRAACESELRWIDAQPILRALEGTP